MRRLRQRRHDGPVAHGGSDRRGRFAASTSLQVLRRLGAGEARAEVVAPTPKPAASHRCVLASALPTPPAASRARACQPVPVALTNVRCYCTGTARGSPFFATWNTRNFSGDVWLEFLSSCTVRGGRLPLCPAFKVTDSLPTISRSIVPSRM